MAEITTTIRAIRFHALHIPEGQPPSPILRGYGEDTPLSFRRIAESEGLEGALWALRTVGRKHHPLLRHYAVDCAERVSHLVDDDDRSMNALATARRHANGEATNDELAAARDAAWDVVGDAEDQIARAMSWASLDLGGPDEELIVSRAGYRFETSASEEAAVRDAAAAEAVTWRVTKEAAEAVTWAAAPDAAWAAAQAAAWGVARFPYYEWAIVHREGEREWRAARLFQLLEAGEYVPETAPARHGGR